MAKVLKQLKMLTDLISEVKQLKEIIQEKDKIVQLKRRVHDLEQHSRMDDVIILGLKVQPRSNAKAVEGGGEVAANAPAEDLRRLKMQVLTFFESKSIDLEANSIQACPTLPRKERKTNPAINLRFVN